MIVPFPKGGRDGFIPNGGVLCGCPPIDVSADCEIHRQVFELDDSFEFGSEPHELRECPDPSGCGAHRDHFAEHDEDGVADCSACDPAQQEDQPDPMWSNAVGHMLAQQKRAEFRPVE